MPKQILKIDQFHGGVNDNADPRDIMPNELDEAVDIMVDEYGKIRTLGGVSTHGSVDARANQINGGYGLFQFSHDRVDGHTKSVGSNDPETGADYLAFSEIDTAGTVDIYSAEDDTWGSPIEDMDDNTEGTRKDVFYYVDGALRVADSVFGNANEPVWYGYVDRYFFGDGTTGYDGNTYDQGKLITQWFQSAAAPKALAIKSFFGYSAGATPDISSPISIDLDSTSKKYQIISTGTTPLQDNVDSIIVTVTFSASSPNVTVTTSGHTAPGLSKFCQIGDKILIQAAADGDNNAIFTVADVAEYGTDPDPNTMDFEEAVLAETNDTVYMYNLSRSQWFDPINTGWQVAVSTLYDDSKQESALNISGTTLQPTDICAVGSQGYHKVRMDVHVFAGNGSSTGLALIHSRVSGFKIYMRRENTSTWFLQSEVDVTKGNKWYGRGDYEMWADGAALTACAHADGEYLEAPRQIETYESETGYDSSIPAVGFDSTDTGYKAAVVANRVAYVGNVRIKDSVGNIKTYGDAILKSVVGKFDSFTYERRLESSIADGDAIIKLETYADRLLEFKKNKMTLINISQDLEFLEDTFLHKGIKNPAAVCKTDFGIAWVNRLGCYLYDGQKVDNLIEKDGRQMMDQTNWYTFAQYTPIIGYIPKKRQIIVGDGVTPAANGVIRLYDMVTRSWIFGSNGTFPDQLKTNMVRDWNDDLMFIHTSDTGTAVIWSDTAVATSALSIKTKDIDFGNPAQKKIVYKIYVSYKGDGSSTTVKYGVNGETHSSDLYAFDSANLADKSSAENLESWHVAELKPGTASQAKNIYSFQIVFGGSAGATFEINDISVVYRLKGTR